MASDFFYDITDGENDVFVNGGNPWKTNEVDRDSGVAIDESERLELAREADEPASRKAEEEDQEQALQKVRREPPPLPPRKLT